LPLHRGDLQHLDQGARHRRAGRPAKSAYNSLEQYLPRTPVALFVMQHVRLPLLDVGDPAARRVLRTGEVLKLR